jgi:hypothetical protein
MGWIDEISPELRKALIIMNTKTLAEALTGTSPNVGMITGDVERCAISRIIQPVINISPTGKAIPVGFMVDSAGTPRPMIDTSGRVTEASGAAISANTGYTWTGVGKLRPSIQNDPTIATQPRIGRAVATLAAGAFANQSLVPALAGYYGVVKIVGVLASDAAVGATLTFESPAATPALPSVFANTYAANVINKDLEDVVISHATLVDNQAIVVDGAGFGAGTVTFLYEYWYET